MGGGLTKEERKQVFYVFSKIDTSKAGHISIDNLKVPVPTAEMDWTHHRHA